MKKVLVIGASVCDIILNVENYPSVCGDENIKSSMMNLGGCAFNVSSVLKYFNIPFDLLSPVGTGTHGEFVRRELNKMDIPILINSEEENGCCYCIVDNKKQLTFLSLHGSEYKFYPEYFKNINPKDYDYVYVCGLELEEKTGVNIIKFLENNDFDIIFAPGPRFNNIDKDLLKRLFALKPIIHINHDEILEYTHLQTIEASCVILNHYTDNTVIVTLSGAGCCYYDGIRHRFIDSYPTKVVDTIGAGDSHCGTLISMLYKGEDISDALDKANMIASKVVSQKGGNLLH